MFQVSFGRDLARRGRALDGLGRKHFATAAARALTGTAFDVRDAEREAIVRVFDRPTRFTTNSLYVHAAAPSRLEAHVYFREFAPKGTPAVKYLAPQVYGGARRLKRFERALQQAGLLPPGLVAVPVSGARLDGHGNMSRGQIVQILSGLKASPDPAQNRTGSARSRRKARRAEYFVGRPGNGPLGVWQRFGFAHGSAVRPVLLFVRPPSYEKRLPFYETASEVACERLPLQIRRAMDKALQAALR